MTPERALAHDERCETRRPHSSACTIYDPAMECDCRPVCCACVSRALAASLQREEEAKGEIARLKSEPKTPVEIHKKLGDMIIEEERLLDRLEELGDTTYAVSDEMVERTRKNISVIVDLNRERDALRAENDRLTLAYAALKEDSDADAEKLSQALSDAGDAIAERNQARHALREAQAEITRLTLAASESARTLQVEIEQMKAESVCWETGHTAEMGARLLRVHCPMCTDAAIKTIQQERDALKNQVTALREALHKFGKHLLWCPAKTQLDVCSCGFDAILAALPQGGA